MAQPSEKLAQSLEILHQLQNEGRIALRSSDLSRTHRERLTKNGFLQEVVNGWYIPVLPNETQGESTAWYASFWGFCATYLNHLKGEDWCLSPEQSLCLHAENWTVPKQLLVRATKARNNVTELLHETSMLVIRSNLPAKSGLVEKSGLRLYSLSSALLACAPGYFKQNPTDTRAALSMVRDASEVLEKLLEGGHSTVAGRLAGAFRNIGRESFADDIVLTMKAAGYDMRETDPFEQQTPIKLPLREQSPLVNRMRLLWQEMREPIIQRFPQSSGLPQNPKAYLKRVEKNYVDDAYNSLSIEGYRVSAELVERIRSGDWNPEKDEDDKNQRNTLAAKGYWQAYQLVQQSIQKILDGNNAGDIVSKDHRNWYREMFAPSITAGILEAKDLAGYRNMPVYIRRSMHVPPSPESVRDVMPVFFDLLEQEQEASVRVVLGHFMFVYIHPYMDGNGRIGRFLMNTMMASGGYPWTVVPLTQRSAYMAALESASVDKNIMPFANFLAGLVEEQLSSL